MGVKCTDAARDRQENQAFRHRRRRAPEHLDREDLAFLLLREVVHLADEPVGALWMTSCPRRSSSCDTFLSLASALSLSLASRRTLRMATRASSGELAHRLGELLARSSVSVGMVSRITLPSLAGVSPRSDFWMAFSIALICGRVPRLDDQASRDPGPTAEASWLIGVRLP